MTTQVRLGNQHPTQSVILPYAESKYRAAVKQYEKSGRKAQPWQVELAKHIFAVNQDHLWTHTKFGYSLPRRNGKNEVVAIRELYALFDGEQVLHTAHRTTTSHSAWERLLRILDKSNVDYDSLKAVGRERIELPDTGGRVEFRTRTSTGGLGEGFDLLVIDEAQEYTTDQESALKYVVSDSKNPRQSSVERHRHLFPVEPYLSIFATMCLNTKWQTRVGLNGVWKMSLTSITVNSGINAILL